MSNILVSLVFCIILFIHIKTKITNVSKYYTSNAAKLGLLYLVSQLYELTFFSKNKFYLHRH